MRPSSKGRCLNCVGHLCLVACGVVNALAGGSASGEALLLKRGGWMALHVCVLLRWIGLTLFDQRLVHVASKQTGIHALGGQAALSPKATEPKGKGGKKVGKEWGEKRLALGQRARTQGPVWL